MQHTSLSSRVLATFKPMVAFVVVLAIRLLPWRAPNVEPLLTAQLPLMRRQSLTAMTLGLASIVVYDAVTAGIGTWTWLVGLSYVALVPVGRWLTPQNATRWQYARSALLLTLLFDLVTGVIAGPLLFHQTFMGALLGQIPFTLRHCLGNTLFAAALAPALERWFATPMKVDQAQVQPA